MWEEPKAGETYSIGADVGLGVGGDPSCACIWNDKTLNQAAELHGQIAPDELAEHLINLGTWYNKAWVGVEANSFGIACLDGMKKKYAKLYYKYKVDQRNDERTKRIGWWTDTKTKPIMIADFGKAVREGVLQINSDQLIDEMFTYVIDDQGSANAEIGCHDDRVVAAMIALQVRKKFFMPQYSNVSQSFTPTNSVTGY